MTADMDLSVYAAAADSPEVPALVTEGKAWTYASLAVRVAGVAAWLEGRGYGRDRPFAFVAERRLETVLAAYGALEIGATLVPLHPRWTEEERRRYADALGIRSWLEPEQLPRRELQGVPSPRRHDDALFLALLPTSGSSGTSKAVALSRGAFRAAAGAHARHLGWQRGDRWLLSLPLAHVGGLSVLTRCLAARRTVVLPPAGESFEASDVLTLLRRDRVTLLSVVPTMLRRLMEIGPPPGSLRLVLVGGAAIPPGQLEDARRAGWPALATYGLTEACAQVATQPPSDLGGAPRRGAPLLPGLDARLDADSVLHLRGPSLMAGYARLPEDTGRAGLETDDAPPWVLGGLDSEGWLRTGDVARFDGDGRLHIVGRQDRTIITGGENVHPTEVEKALLELPGVEAACVVGVEDPRWGQAVAAAIVPTGDTKGDGDEDFRREVRRGLEGKIAGFKKPHRLRTVEELPVTATGKIDPKAVRKLF